MLAQINGWFSGLLNWHDDAVAIREGRLIMPKLSPNIADFSGLAVIIATQTNPYYANPWQFSLTIYP